MLENTENMALRSLQNLSKLSGNYPLGLRSVCPPNAGISVMQVFQSQQAVNNVCLHCLFQLDNFLTTYVFL